MARLGARFGMTRYEADEYYRIAIGHYEKRNLDKAILEMDNAIDLYARRAEYWATRGYFKLEDGLYPEATEDFDRALEINPYEILANYGKGAVAYYSDDFEVAREYFIQAWAADSERPEIHYYIALTHHRQRDNAEAKEWMQQAADIYAKTAEDDKDARKQMKNAERWIREFNKLIKAQQQRDKKAQSTS